MINPLSDNLFVTLYPKYKKSRSATKKKYFKEILDYYLEVSRSIADLYWTNSYIARSLDVKDKDQRVVEVRYNLGNFYLRWYLFNEKLNQFINATYLGMSEENPTIGDEIRRNIKTEKIKNILKILDDSSEVKNIKKIRKYFTHRKYTVVPYALARNKYPTFFKYFTLNQLGTFTKVLKLCEQVLEEVCEESLKYIEKNK